jgi:hypothetical protein
MLIVSEWHASIRRYPGYIAQSKSRSYHLSDERLLFLHETAAFVTSIDLPSIASEGGLGLAAMAINS